MAIPEKINISLRKSESWVMILTMTNSTADRTPRPSQLPNREKAEAGLRRFAHNLRRESIFSYFFARNPLKSPDSDE
jgi:hypothetical protein